MKIADLKFNILSAKFFAYCRSDPDCIKWSIEINAQISGNAFGTEYDLEMWQPQLEVDAIFTTSKGSVKHWTEAFPKEVTWQGSSGEENEHGARMYVFGHEPIYDSKISLSKLTGNQCEVFWTGKCDILWDLKYSKGLDFELNSKAEFVGIPCARRSEAEARELLLNAGFDDQFEFTQNDSGVTIMKPI